MRICRYLGTVALSATLTASAFAGGPDLDGTTLFGIDRETGLMLRYDFADQQLISIGNVRDASGTSLLGIDAAAYIPGHQNIYGAWVDPSDELSKLLYINTETAKATIVGQDLGAGQVTGAVAALIHQMSGAISGSININPNNNPPNEFVLTKSDGSTITRDDLHMNANVDDAGVLYEGGASSIRVKPKGNGNQNGLAVGVETVSLKNSNTYLISGDNLTVSLRNDHVHNSNAMGHWWIDVAASSASIQAVGGDDDAIGIGWTVFAVQNVESTEDDAVDFEIEGATIVPSETFAAKVSVLGAAISAGGSYHMPVTVELEVNGSGYTPWGPVDKAVAGNVNDNENPRHHVFPNTFDAGTPIDVIGRAWTKKKSWYGGNKNRHWKIHRTIDGSDTSSPYVIVLRDGDEVPDIAGFMDQDDIVAFVEDFIGDENKIVLDKNQAIFLFELGVTNLNSAAADFQDLVVLVTLAKDSDDFDEGDDNDSGSAGRLIRINHKTGGHAQLMTLDRVYDGLATTDGDTFFATFGQDLYEVIVSDQTETLVGTMPASNMFGLEFFGSNLLGFEIAGDKLVPLDVETGDVLGAMSNLGMTDLGTIIFMPIDQDPAKQPKGYD